MPATILTKLESIVEEIDRNGNADRLRLTVLKKWFGSPDRLRAFAAWLAGRALARGRPRATGEARVLFDEAHALLSAPGVAEQGLGFSAARDLYFRLKAFQNEHKRLEWGAVRQIRDWDLVLIEEALAICVAIRPTPASGYQLAADYCVHYSSGYGAGLNGPARERVQEIIAFIRAYEGG
ncbi:hypothetical protein Thimo_0214 [Thioflavicoccus mobilis 8321]|uniref:Uncharacterized protein n=1 Tax=Thioflavicoccus mobilis 8321 TaxID=765912 RepID=L0GSW7_9GAMM|nr:hypothetical protein [Thioflavicoccus mobilis]AGA89086.1 hypothetical protein Thimo_0214 [Thioflavicoccus mobilis 8321]